MSDSQPQREPEQPEVSTPEGDPLASDVFNADVALQMFTFRAKSSDGEGVSLDICRKYAHPDIYFQDAIQIVNGREDYVEMMRRFPTRVEHLSCKVHEIQQHGNIIFLEWSMDMIANKRMPLMTNHGATKLTVSEDGKLIRHRDYFDLWGDMIDAFPRVAKGYRRFVQNLE